MILFFFFTGHVNGIQHDKIWMGYERKRGKLGELNALIRGDGNEYFSEIVGDEEYIQHVKYIITLDTDTQLPRDAAWKMVGTMAHPLNHPVYNEKKNELLKDIAFFNQGFPIACLGRQFTLCTDSWQ